MEKAIININDLIKSYQDKPNLHYLAKQYHTSHLRLAQILREAGVSLQNIGKRKDISNEDLKVIISEYNNGVSMEDLSQKYNIRIKKLRELFRQKGVTISKWRNHIKKTRTNKEKAIKAIRESKRCALCNWITFDVHNHNHSYANHLKNIHHYTLEDFRKHAELYPEDIPYIQSELDKLNMVQCKICGEYHSIIDDRHLRKHNITKSEYLSLYGGNIISLPTLGKLQSNMRKMQDNPNWERFSSSYEKEIQGFLKENHIEYEDHKRGILANNRELDIYIPSMHIAIEFDGCLQHTEWFGKKDSHYHLSKIEECKSFGIKLIHIFEDEYVYSSSLVYDKLSHLLHINDNLTKIYARKCNVKEISLSIANEFLFQNHIQGFASSSVYLGAYYKDTLVGVMTFKKEKDDTRWELTRFATDNSVRCIGLGGKLFQYFVKNWNPDYVKSFADRRWTINEDNLYTKIGFVKDGYTKPDYHYYYLKDNKPQRFHKFGFRKQTLHRKYGLPLTMSETEMVQTLGYDRIWDCGLIRYVWKKDSEI